MACRHIYIYIYIYTHLTSVTHQTIRSVAVGAHGEKLKTLSLNRALDARAGRRGEGGGGLDVPAERCTYAACTRREGETSPCGCIASRELYMHMYGVRIRIRIR